MDNLDHSSDSPSSIGLSLTEQAKHFLSEAGKWGRFISIVGFVAIGLLVLVGLSAGAIFGNLPGMEELPFPAAIFGVVYLVIAAIYFFPVLYLFRFSTKIREALNIKDEAVLQTSFENLKSLLKYMGIVTIVMLALYALIFVFAIIGGLLAM